MVLSKSYRVYHKSDKDAVHSIILEHRNQKSETLLFEAGAVAVLCKL